MRPVAALPTLPRIDRLSLAELTLPDSHPHHGEGACAVLAYLVHHPDGPILFDTGVGHGNRLIEELYHPVVHDLVESIEATGTDPRDVTAIALSHLHFDHCGQHAALPHAPVHVQAAEVEAATEQWYTVPKWAAIEPERLRAGHGDEVIADGVRLLATPGHTVGHQSMAIESDDGTAVVVGQCVWKADEMTHGHPHPAEAQEELAEVAVDSLARLRALDPVLAVFAHDTRELRR